MKAKIDGLKAERWWGKHKLPDVELQKEYLYSELINMHPMNIQQGIFMVAGLEAGNISNLRITEGDPVVTKVFLVNLILALTITMMNMESMFPIDLDKYNSYKWWITGTVFSIPVWLLYLVIFW